MYGVQSIPGMGLSAHIRKLCVYKQKDFYSGGYLMWKRKKQSRRGKVTGGVYKDETGIRTGRQKAE